MASTGPSRGPAAVDRALVTSQVVTGLVHQGRGTATDACVRVEYGKGRPVPVSFAALGWVLRGTGIEEGAFDPRRPNDYYFLTGDTRDTSFMLGSRSRDGGVLWLLRQADASRPEHDATLTLVLDGSEAPRLNTPVSLTIDHRGNLLVQDSPVPGGESTRVLAYRITGEHDVRVEFDAELVTPGSPALFALDEECSALVDGARPVGRRACHRDLR